MATPIVQYVGIMTRDEMESKIDKFRDGNLTYCFTAYYDDDLVNDLAESAEWIQEVPPLY